MKLCKIVALLLPALAATAAEYPVRIVPGSLDVAVAVKSTLHDFTARVTGGELAVSTDRVTGAIVGAVFTFDWRGVTTGNDTRDREMLEWLGANEQPKGVFTLESLESRADGQFAKGKLELHGMSREIGFPVRIVPSATGFKVSGEATIDHRDWGLKQIRRFALLTVNPVVTVHFKFETSGPG